MGAAIGPVILGAIITVLGICNMNGNVSSIHWYHRQRVSEEDILPFGRLVGLGTVIIGVCVMLMGGLVQKNACKNKPTRCRRNVPVALGVGG